MVCDVVYKNNNNMINSTLPEALDAIKFPPLRSLLITDIKNLVRKTEICMGAIRKQHEDKELSEEDAELWIAQTLRESGAEVQSIVDHYMVANDDVKEEVHQGTDEEWPAKKRTKD